MVKNLLPIASFQVVCPVFHLTKPQFIVVIPPEHQMYLIS